MRSPLTHPPKGSRLAFYAECSHFKIDDDEYRQTIGPEGRAARTYFALLEDPRIWRLHFEDYRDFVLIPDLEKMGMPSAPRPEWLTGLIDAAADQIRRLDWESDPRPQPPKRPGRPTGGALEHFVLASYYLAKSKLPSASDTRLFDEAAEHLGVGANVVRRTLQRNRRLWVRDEAIGRAVIAACLAVAGIMRDFDNNSGWKASRRS